MIIQKKSNNPIGFCELKTTFTDSYSLFQEHSPKTQLPTAYNT